MTEHPTDTSTEKIKWKIRSTGQVGGVTDVGVSWKFWFETTGDSL